MDKDKYLPKYIKVKNKIKKLIEQNKLVSGNKLPSEKELVNKYDVSRHTVRKAQNLLVSEGYLEKKQGIGTFLKEKSPQKSGDIAFISISIKNYIFVEILTGIDKILSKKKYQIVLGNSHDSQKREADLLNNFLEKNINGLILEPAQSAKNYSNIRLLKKFRKKNIPVVILDTKFTEEEFNYVLLAELEGGYKAVNYMIQNGHKKIAIIYKSQHKPALLRLKGYKKALKDNKIEIKNKYIKKYIYSELRYKNKFETEIEEICDKLLKLENSPTAIFCFNDQVAILVKEILQKKGLEIPQDISLIGFDNSKLVQLSGMNITSVKHPQEQAGKKAAHLILSNIENEKESPRQIKFDTELITRGSVENINKSHKI